jgi:putative peptidoglycan lipid II flippase
VQLWGGHRCGLNYRPLWDWRHPDLRKYVFLTLPLMLGLTMTFSSEFLFRFFGSFLPAGNIAVLNFGLRVMLILVGLFGQAIGTASYPYMTRLVVEKGVSAMNRLLNTTLRYLALVMPFSILIVVLRFEIVRILFQRGRFDVAATAVTADVLLCFMVGAFAYSAYTMVVRAYFASQNTLFPAIYGTVAVLLSLPIYLIGLKFMGVYGIALAVSLSGILQVLCLFILWNRRSRNTGSRRVYAAYLKLALLSVLLGAMIQGFKSAFMPDPAGQPMLTSLLVATAVGGIFLVFLAGLGYGLNISEVKEPLERVAAKLKAR